LYGGVAVGFTPTYKSRTSTGHVGTSSAMAAAVYAVNDRNWHKADVTRGLPVCPLSEVKRDNISVSTEATSRPD